MHSNKHISSSNLQRVMGVGKVVGDTSWIGDGGGHTNVRRHYIGEGCTQAGEDDVVE